MRSPPDPPESAAVIWNEKQGKTFRVAHFFRGLPEGAPSVEGRQLVKCLIQFICSRGQTHGTMPESAETESFIRNSFRSVWALELLLLLKADSGRAWSPGELVERLRGSELVVRQGIDSLVAGGLVVMEGDGEARYAPASPDLERLVENTEQAYAKKPDAVRRLIVLSSHDQLAAFANAFRLRKD